MQMRAGPTTPPVTSATAPEVIGFLLTQRLRHRQRPSRKSRRKVGRASLPITWVMKTTIRLQGIDPEAVATARPKHSPSEPGRRV
jgi:hypothetical protein